MKKLEIERRFLLKKLPDLTKPHKLFIIKQYYNKTEGGVIRYRESREYANFPNKYEKIIKLKVSKGINNEEDFEIDQLQFFNEIQQIKNLKSIKKHRIVFEENGLKWEVDSFNDLKLIICEVELKSLKQKIQIPEHIQKVLIKEITGEYEFSNYNLAQ